MSTARGKKVALTAPREGSRVREASRSTIQRRSCDRLTSRGAMNATLATPIDHAFEVQATWGQLTGRAGDYLVKNFQDRGTAYPVDVWIVDQTLFRQTYEAIAR